MVQASTLVLAAFVAAPVLSAPLSVKVGPAPLPHQRSVDEVDNLDLRDPFNFGRIFRSVGNVVKNVAIPAAKLLLRDVDGNLVERDITLDDLLEIDTREPHPFNFGKLLRGGLKVAGTAARILLRDAEGNIYVRDVDLSDLSERDLQDLEDLDAREPFRFGNFIKGAGGVLRKAGGVVSKATNVAGTLANVASGFGLREVDDASELDARDIYFLDLSDLSERDLAELDIDLESREPFRFGNFIKGAGGVLRKAGGVVSKATNVAGTLANVASGFGLREIEDGSDYDVRDAYYAIDEFDEREFDEAFEDMEARSIDELD